MAIFKQSHYLKTSFLGLSIIALIFLSKYTTKYKDSIEQKSDSTGTTLTGIWQLDYYPDSILYYKDITKYSKWSSQYAYNIEFVADSCQFIGCHESWWMKIKRLNDSTYITLSDQNDYWEFKFNKDKLRIREIRKGNTFEYYPYHHIDEILTLEAIQKQFAKEVFIGQYKVLSSDSLACAPIISFNDQFNIEGIESVDKYTFKVFIDWDEPLDNKIRLTGTNHAYHDYSFQFHHDTLKLMNFKYITSDEGDSYTAKITTPALLLKKL